MADPNQTPQRDDWKCPCNGCKKAAKHIIDQIIEDYMSCPNMMEVDENIYCHTWYRHDDCERLRGLLLKITNHKKYVRPEPRQEIKDAISDMLTDPSTSEILNRLKD